MAYLDTWEKNKRHRPGFLDRLTLALMPEQRTLIGSLDPVTLARQVDISHWDGDCDIARMGREGDVSLVFAKCSDGKQVQSGSSTYPGNYVDDWLYRNVQKCYDAGIPCGVYHYVQPFFEGYTVQGTTDWNMTTLHAALDKLVPNVSYHAIVLDVEERAGTDPNASDVVLKMIAAIRADPKFSQVPLIIYTSVGCLSFYAKLRDQTSYQGAGYNFWMAQWVYTTATTTTWAELIANIMPKISMKVLTPGYANWKFLQWSSSCILPGCAVRLDLNFYNGTKAALYAWLKYKYSPPPTDPPPPPPPTTGVTRVEFDALAARVAALEHHKHTTGEPQL